MRKRANATLQDLTLIVLCSTQRDAFIERECMKLVSENVNLTVPQAGTPAAVIQELGGWASHEMVRRYAHLSAEHLHSWVDRLGRDDFARLKEQRVGLTDPKCL